MSLRVYDDWSECAGFSETWDNVVGQQACIPFGLGPFCRFGVTKLVHEILGHHRKPRIYADVSDTNKSVIIPCCTRVSGKWPSVRELSLIQDLYPGRAGFVIGSGGHDNAITLIDEMLSRSSIDWDVFNLNLVAGSVSEEILLHCLSKSKLSHHAREVEHIPYIQFPSSWEEMNASLAKKYRHTIKKSTKELKKLGALEIKEYKLPENAGEFIDAYQAVETTSWKAQAGTSINLNSEQQQFHSQLAGTNEPVCNRVGYTLNLDGQPIAYIYGVKIGNVYCDLKESFDVSFSKYSPGAVLKSLVFMNVIDNGIRYWDFIGKAEFHKLRWTKQTYVQKNYMIFSNSFSGQVAKWRNDLRRLLNQHFLHDSVSNSECGVCK